MVRSLSGTLTTAVGAKTRIPAVTLSAQDQVMHLQNTVTTSNTDAFSSACVANDGSIIRVRLTRDPAGITTFSQNFQWQRITDVTSASQWQTWTTLTGGSGNMAQDSGCAVSNNSGTIRAFAQQGTGGNAIFTWSSTNNGTSWSGSATTVLSPPAAGLTKGISSAGNNDVFFLYDVVAGDAIGSSVFSGGAWSALQTWSLPAITYVGNDSGLAVVWHSADSLYYVIYSDFYALHLATATSNRVTWTALQDIAPSVNGANIIRIVPQIALFDGIYNMICTEIDNGTYTGTAYKYPRVRQSIDLIHWSNGFILEDMSYYFGATIQKAQTPSDTRQKYVVATMTKVFYSNAYLQSDATQYADMSAKIIEYKRSDDINKPSTLAVALDNAGSAITSLVSNYGVTYEPFGLNNKLVLSEGYKTGSPPTTVEVVNTGTYRIKAIIFERSPGVNHIVLEALDLSHVLDHKNRYQVTYINQTLSYMIKEVCAKAGLLNISVPSTSQMSTNIVAFILHAGQSYRAVLDELCRIGWLEYYLDQTETMIFKELASGDTSVWTYTPEIETLVLGSDDIRGNHVVVTGLPPVSSFLWSVTNGEAYDTTHAHVTGQERVEIDTDTKLITAGLCATKAAFILAQEERDQVAHSVTVPLNPALQLVDVVTLNDQAPLVGTSQSAVARIFKDEVHYLPEKAIFEMKLDLEGV